MSGYEGNTLVWAVLIVVIWPYVMKSFPEMESKFPGREAAIKRQRVIGGFGVLNILLATAAAISAARNDHPIALGIATAVVVLQVVGLWWLGRTRWVS